MGAPCYRKGYETGPWYEIKTMVNVVKSKEANGLDVSFERSLLRSWAKYPGYEGVKKALNSLVRDQNLAAISLVNDKNPMSSKIKTFKPSESADKPRVTISQLHF